MPANKNEWVAIKNKARLVATESKANKIKYINVEIVILCLKGEGVDGGYKKLLLRDAWLHLKNKHRLEKNVIKWRHMIGQERARKETGRTRSCKTKSKAGDNDKSSDLRPIKVIMCNNYKFFAMLSITVLDNEMGDGVFSPFFSSMIHRSFTCASSHINEMRPKEISKKI